MLLLGSFCLLPLSLLVTVIVVVAAAAVAGVVVCCHVLAVLGSYWGGAVGTLLLPWPWHIAIPGQAFPAKRAPALFLCLVFATPLWATSNKKLLGTSAILVVTRSYQEQVPY